MRTSETFKPRNKSLNSVTYAFATSGAYSPVSGTGLVTISTKGIPARL